MGTFTLRATAFIIALGLIILLSLAGIGLIALGGPALTHGSGMGHDAGIIVAIGPGTDFSLKVDNGPTLHFQCQDRCRNQVSHMQRHLIEHAHTDVYFVHGTNNILIATDVD